MASINVKIFSMKKTFLEGTYDMIVVPGVKGDIGIESSERDFVYLLKNGIIYLFKNNKVIKRAYIFKGQVKAKNDNVKITLLDSDFFDLESIDNNLVVEELNSLKKLQKEAKEDYLKHYYDEKVALYQDLKESININYYK